MKNELNNTHIPYRRRLIKDHSYYDEGLITVMHMSSKHSEKPMSIETMWIQTISKACSQIAKCDDPEP